MAEATKVETSPDKYKKFDWQQHVRPIVTLLNQQKNLSIKQKNEFIQTLKEMVEGRDSKARQKINVVTEKAFGSNHQEVDNKIDALIKARNDWLNNEHQLEKSEQSELLWALAGFGLMGVGLVTGLSHVIFLALVAASAAYAVSDVFIGLRKRWQVGASEKTLEGAAIEGESAHSLENEKEFTDKADNRKGFVGSFTRLRRKLPLDNFDLGCAFMGLGLAALSVAMLTNPAVPAIVVSAAFFGGIVAASIPVLRTTGRLLHNAYKNYSARGERDKALDALLNNNLNNNDALIKTDTNNLDALNNNQPKSSIEMSNKDSSKVAKFLQTSEESEEIKGLVPGGDKEAEKESVFNTFRGHDNESKYQTRMEEAIEKPEGESSQKKRSYSESNLDALKASTNKRSEEDEGEGEPRRFSI